LFTLVHVNKFSTFTYIIGFVSSFFNKIDSIWMINMFTWIIFGQDFNLLVSCFKACGWIFTIRSKVIIRICQELHYCTRSIQLNIASKHKSFICTVHSQYQVNIPSMPLGLINSKAYFRVLSTIKHKYCQTWKKRDELAIIQEVLAILGS
jgi:hypothetical protein